MDCLPCQWPRPASLGLRPIHLQGGGTAYGGGGIYPSRHRKITEDFTMKELFNNIISVQFGASIAIVFLLLSRRTMKKHYVAKLRYWLWLIIALRLCLPVDINIQLNRTAPVNIPVRDYYISAQQPQIDGQMTEFEIITADQLNSRPMENTEYTQEIPPVISTVSITDILYRIWLAVAVLLGVVSVISYILAKRDIMSTAFYDDNLAACMENLKKQ
ncbi:MAG: hypothetical protein E7492_08060, partial [Ruminococcaceae bacterium]|nr:hypothetical protein [Oscillospiraceae bacterium]